MQNYELGIPIIIEASLGLLLSFIILYDIIIHYSSKQYQLELGLLFTNFVQSIFTIILAFELSNMFCLVTFFLVQCLTLSSFLWTILILQKSCLLTRYPIQIALEYLQTNQFILQVIIANGLPLVASSFVFLKQYECSLDNIVEVSSKLFWAIQSILTVIFIGIIAFHVIRIHLFSKNIKLYSYMIYCALIFFFTLPWIIYTTVDFELDKVSNVTVTKCLFLLKNTQICLSSYLFGYRTDFQLVFLEKACPILRKQYLLKYGLNNYQEYDKSQQDIEINNTSICSQLLIK